MEKNKILPIISILFALTIIVILAVWLITTQQKPEPEYIEEQEEEFIPAKPIDEEVEESFPIEAENDIAFQEIIAQLNTSQKLVNYLNKNFSFEEEESDQSLTPEKFFKIKKGKRNDIATFSSFVLFQNGYFATIFRYKFIDRENKEGIRTITLFREKDVTKYIDLEGSKLGIYLGGSSPVELLELEEKRYNVKIIEYAAFTYGSTDLSEADWLPR